MNTGKNDFIVLEQILCDSGVSQERVTLALQYISEIETLLQNRKKRGETVFWKDLPWVIQFLPVISYFYGDSELINYLNPCPEVGGMSGLIGYSKDKLHAKFPGKYMPKSLFFEKRTDMTEVVLKTKQEGIDFPFFCKPDRGERAALVRRVASKEELEMYLNEFPDNNSLIVQAPAGSQWPERYEYGVQVVRNIETDELDITSAELKSVPCVKGDGKRTVEMLVEELCELTDSQKKNVLGDLSLSEKQFIPEDGTKINVVNAASVSRGTKMITLKNEFSGSDLEKALREVLSEIKHFSSGRFDLVSYSEEGLCAGEFEIIEGNAGAAIPLQVYRTDLTIAEVYTILFHHFVRLKKNAEINRDRYDAGLIEGFQPMRGMRIAGQLVKGLLQQRSQWKNLSSNDTREMYLDIMKNTRGERWALQKSKFREFSKQLLEKKN